MSTPPPPAKEDPKVDPAADPAKPAPAAEENSAEDVDDQAAFAAIEQAKGLLDQITESIKAEKDEAAALLCKQVGDLVTAIGTHIAVSASPDAERGTDPGNASVDPAAADPAKVEKPSADPVSKAAPKPEPWHVRITRDRAGARR